MAKKTTMKKTPNSKGNKESFSNNHSVGPAASVVFEKQLSSANLSAALDSGVEARAQQAKPSGSSKNAGKNKS